MSAVQGQVRHGSPCSLVSSTIYPSMRSMTKFGIGPEFCEHQKILTRVCADWLPKTRGLSRVETAGHMGIVFNEPTPSFVWLHRYCGGFTVCSVEMACGSSCFAGRFDTTGYSVKKMF